jgi:hypothetical protein
MSAWHGAHTIAPWPQTEGALPEFVKAIGAARFGAAVAPAARL